MSGTQHCALKIRFVLHHLRSSKFRRLAVLWNSLLYVYAIAEVT